MCRPNTVELYCTDKARSTNDQSIGPSQASRVRVHVIGPVAMNVVRDDAEEETS